MSPGFTPFPDDDAVPAPRGSGSSVSGPEPGHPLDAPQAAELPSDVVLLDGPVAGDPAELLPRLRAVLSRPGPAVVVATSGSTGRPKKTVLSSEALTASGRATERATSGPGQWMLCLPAHYVAGVQVLARSVLAGTTPVVLGAEHFTPEAFAHAAESMEHAVRYVSVVPTQLQRILDPADGSPDSRAVAALARFDAVLVGGSPLSPALAALADASGVRVARTYGMSETCGGCVYNGVPLDTVTVRILPDDADPHLDHAPAASAPPAEPGTADASAASAEPADSFPAGASATGDSGPAAPVEGRIWLGGEVVASGYLDDPEQTAAHFRVADGRRWYRTDDLGSLDEHGRLTVLGRTDDVINTGGVKVSAGRVAEVLRADERVRQALVVPVAHPEWGQTVAAVVAARTPRSHEGTRSQGSSPEHRDLEHDLSHAVRERLGAPAVPKQWRHVAHLPLLTTGKPDRRAAAALFTEEPAAPPQASDERPSAPRQGPQHPDRASS